MAKVISYYEFLKTCRILKKTDVIQIDDKLV